MESPDLIVVVVYEHRNRNCLVFELEQEPFFPRILFKELRSLRLYENLKLLESICFVPLQEQNIVRFEAFSVLEGVNMEFALVPDKIDPTVGFLQIVHISTEIGNKGLFLGYAIVVHIDEPVLDGQIHFPIASDGRVIL